MTNTRKPVSFIASDNPEVALTFYSEVMELELLESTPFALVFSDGDHVLRVQVVSKMEPAEFTAHGWQVADIEAEIERLISKGVAVLSFDQLPQDALGIWTTPDGNKIAWFHDPCGNILSFTQFIDR